MVADTSLKLAGNHLFTPGIDYTCTNKAMIMAVSDRAAILMTCVTVDMLAFVLLFWFILYKLPKRSGLVSASHRTKTVSLPALDDIGLLNDNGLRSPIGSFIDLEKDEVRLIQTNNTTTEVFNSENAAKAASLPLINSLDNYYLDKQCIDQGEYLQRTPFKNHRGSTTRLSK